MTRFFFVSKGSPGLPGFKGEKGDPGNQVLGFIWFTYLKFRVLVFQTPDNPF